MAAAFLAVRAAIVSTSLNDGSTGNTIVDFELGIDGIEIVAAGPDSSLDLSGDDLVFGSLTIALAGLSASALTESTDLVDRLVLAIALQRISLLKWGSVMQSLQCDRLTLMALVRSSRARIRPTLPLLSPIVLPVRRE